MSTKEGKETRKLGIYSTRSKKKKKKKGEIQEVQYNLEAKVWH